jgi:His-Xaa-Ser system radical SAM maturase HxsB
MRDIKPFNYFIKDPTSYNLLPFRFYRLKNGKELAVNEFGDYLFLDKGTIKKLVQKEINKKDVIYKDLYSNYFVYEGKLIDILEVLATRYRTKKSFLFNFTGLHIIVMTLRCNHVCKYCQVSRKNKYAEGYDISYDDLDNIINLIFKSPSQDITIELQGGEPLLVFDKVKYVIKKSDKLNKKHSKNLTFVLCTNLVEMNYEHLKFFKKYKVLISTSLDGPEFIHNINRIIEGHNSYKLVINGIKKCQEVLGIENVSGLMTTTKIALAHHEEIIDEYIKQGFRSIFLRPLNPYGLAIQNDYKNNYSTENFIEFYKRAFLYIIELNKNGIFFIEEYANIILTKILTPFNTGFTDLQSPSGIINSVVVYNYDGFVYASDESRMLAEMGDDKFKLGKIFTSSYKEIFHGEKVKEISQYCLNESLPGCSECVFQIYCGADPVRNYATQGDMVGKKPTDSFCKKNKSIFEFIFKMLDEDKEVERIFYSWINKIEL